GAAKARAGMGGPAVWTVWLRDRPKNTATNRPAAVSAANPSAPRDIPTLLILRSARAKINARLRRLRAGNKDGLWNFVARDRQISPKLEAGWAGALRADPGAKGPSGLSALVTVLLTLTLLCGSRSNARVARPQVDRRSAVRSSWRGFRPKQNNPNP